MTSGRIFDIQRFTIHDGPGIRTTVFFKGCRLRCLWCSNPEGQSSDLLLSYEPQQCIGCRECLTRCPGGALSAATSGRAELDRLKCTRCGECVAPCDPKALQIVGRDATVEAVLEVVLRDRDYYSESGGGLTLSGGDPLFQPRFAAALLRSAKDAGLHCCVETSGDYEWEVVESLVPLVDLWLFDCKETEPELHKKFTGVDNSRLRTNLRMLHDGGARILLRCPIIPDHNARKDHLDGIAALARALPRLEGVEILGYFDLWRAKLARLGLTSGFPESVKPPSPPTIKSWIEYLRAQGVRGVH